MKFTKRFASISGGKDLKEIIRGASVTFILRVIGLITSYIFNIIFARIYGADIIGIFAIATATTGIFGLFASFGSQTSVVRFVSQYANENNWNEVNSIYKKYLLILLPVALFLMFVFYLSSSFLANTIFRNDALILPFKLMAFTLPISVIFNINSSALRGLKEITKSFVFQALIPLFNLFTILFITYEITKNYLVPIYAQITTTILVAGLSYILWKKVINKKNIEKIKQYKNNVNVKEIIDVSFPMLITAGMFYILGWTDTIMLGVFKNEVAVGVYRIALKIALFTSFTLSAVNSIAGPKFSELYWGKNYDRLKSTIQNSAQIIFFTSLPILLITIVFSSEILWLFGEKFMEGRIVLIILSIGQFINAAFGSVGLLLDMTGNQKIFRNAVIFGAVLNIILNAMLIPPYGIIGAAIATALSTVIWNLKTAISVYKIFGYWVGYKPKLKIIT